jgi:hypothetical protein
LPLLHRGKCRWRKNPFTNQAKGEESNRTTIEQYIWEKDILAARYKWATQGLQVPPFSLPIDDYLEKVVVISRPYLTDKTLHSPTLRKINCEKVCAAWLEYAPNDDCKEWMLDFPLWLPENWETAFAIKKTTQFTTFCEPKHDV